MSSTTAPASWRRPRRAGLPNYLYVVTFSDGSENWYWPDDTDMDTLFRDDEWRDDYEITVVWWD